MTLVDTFLSLHTGRQSIKGYSGFGFLSQGRLKMKVSDRMKIGVLEATKEGIGRGVGNQLNYFESGGSHSQEIMGRDDW